MDHLNIATSVNCVLFVDAMQLYTVSHFNFQTESRKNYEPDFPTHIDIWWSSTFYCLVLIWASYIPSWCCKRKWILWWENAWYCCCLWSSSTSYCLNKFTVRWKVLDLTQVHLLCKWRYSAPIKQHRISISSSKAVGEIHRQLEYKLSIHAIQESKFMWSWR